MNLPAFRNFDGFMKTVDVLLSDPMVYRLSLLGSQFHSNIIEPRYYITKDYGWIGSIDVEKSPFPSIEL